MMTYWNVKKILLLIGTFRNQGSSVSMTRLRTNGIQFLTGMQMGLFLLITASRLALECTQPLIQWIEGAHSLGVKEP
jgi:hypothetical protein